MSLSYAESELNWKTIEFCFLSKPQIRENPNWQVIGQRTLVQLDFNILLMECFSVFDCFHEYMYQGKVTFEIITFYWVCSGTPSYTQTCLDLSEVPLGSLGSISILKIIQNGRVMDFQVNKSIFSSIWCTKFQVKDQSDLLPNSRAFFKKSWKILLLTAE